MPWGRGGAALDANAPTPGHGRTRPKNTRALFATPRTLLHPLRPNANYQVTW